MFLKGPSSSFSRCLMAIPATRRVIREAAASQKYTAGRGTLCPYTRTLETPIETVGSTEAAQYHRCIFFEAASSMSKFFATRAKRVHAHAHQGSDLNFRFRSKRPQFSLFAFRAKRDSNHRPSRSTTHSLPLLRMHCGCCCLLLFFCYITFIICM